jgi:hypothetical protein
MGRIAKTWGEWSKAGWDPLFHALQHFPAIGPGNGDGPGILGSTQFVSPAVAKHAIPGTVDQVGTVTPEHIRA